MPYSIPVCEEEGVLVDFPVIMLKSESTYITLPRTKKRGRSTGKQNMRNRSGEE
jgi:hypothetical protein